MNRPYCWVWPLANVLNTWLKLWVQLPTPTAAESTLIVARVEPPPGMSQTIWKRPSQGFKGLIDGFRFDSDPNAGIEGDRLGYGLGKGAARNREMIFLEENLLGKVAAMKRTSGYGVSFSPAAVRTFSVSTIG